MQTKLSDYIYHKPIFLTFIREIEGRLYKKHLKLKGKTLDFGCGDGFFATQFFDKKIDYGVDVEKRIRPLAQASKAYKKVVIYDGHTLPFKNNTFDTVVSNCVLEHIPNIDENLNEIYRVLKPGGKFYTTVAEAKWNDFLFGKIFLKSLYVKWMQHKQVHYNLLKKNKWEDKIKKIKLKILFSEYYLTRRLVRMIDISHYLGIFDLFTHKLSGTWVIFPSLRKYFPLSRALSWGEKDQNRGGAVFLVAQK